MVGWTTHVRFLLLAFCGQALASVPEFLEWINNNSEIVKFGKLSNALSAIMKGKHTKAHVSMEHMCLVSPSIYIWGSLSVVYHMLSFLHSSYPFVVWYIIPFRPKIP